MSTEMSYPQGAPDERQMAAAAHGRELFARLAAAHGVTEDADFAATPGPDGSVVVTRRVKGGGRIYVASDLSVLYVASSLGTGEADAAFLEGVRTPIEKFGMPLTS